MTDDRDKLLQIMSSLESDYRSGKISAEKYRYFRSKYEDKLNSIDALEATRRIRSMQGKSTAPKTSNKRSRKPAIDKRKQEQDLVQKYIINPKKDDARYNKKKKSSMNSNTFKLIAVIVLVVAFTAGVAYGIFNLDSETVASYAPVGLVEDTAFPEIVAVVNTTVVNDTSNDTFVEDTDDDKDDEKVETTTETTTTTTTTFDDSSSSQRSDSSSSSSSSSSQSSEPAAPAPSESSSESSSDGGSQSTDSGDSGSQGGDSSTPSTSGE